MAKADADLHFFQDEDTRALCFLFLIGQADDLIQVEITHADLNCDRGEFVEVGKSRASANLFEALITCNPLLKIPGCCELICHALKVCFTALDRPQILKHEYQNCVFEMIFSLFLKNRSFASKKRG